MLPSERAQLDAQLEHGISPLLIVAASEGTGRFVYSAHAQTLQAGTLVGLYRCLLVRTKRFEKWQREGLVHAGVDDFWRNYTVTLRFDDSPKREWLCLPVGDAKGSDEDDWWTLGSLSTPALQSALAGLNARQLVSWQRAYDPAQVSDDSLPSSRLLSLAHIFNEPTGEDEPPNVDVRAYGAFHCGKKSYCGIMMAAAATRPIRLGEHLVWCYGEGFTRHYAVSSHCLKAQTTTTAQEEAEEEVEDDGLPPPLPTPEADGPRSRHDQATELLTRGKLAGKAAKHEFRQNCAAVGLAEADSEDGRRFADELFERWDSSSDGYLERHEVEAGMKRLAAEMAD